MKKVISILLAVVMILSFAACGNKNTPEKNLDAMLTALKNGDMETLAALNDEENFDISGQEDMLSIFTSLSWTFGETVMEDDDDATINVQITTTDMQTVFSEFMTQAMSQAMQGMEMTEDTTSQLLLDIMNTTEETATFDVAVDMSLEDGKWIVDDDNDEFFNAITGGLMEASEELGSMFG